MIQFFRPLPSANLNLIYVSHNGYIKASNIIPSLNKHNTVKPNSTFTQTLKLLSKNIYDKLISLVNLSLLSGSIFKYLKY